ncbi:hypothetical protein DNL40_01350 [Xylanimonas oleitrophica]|uniref:ABC3 transporter permease C-terminal domain-containing protein n=2 Tax=Xylanimonas oleitrophica TaxID=2607479 RepID=A0A2W5WUV9_9MICO|nr:hypothetical protein DNL40_01350 [Xylanimonas oleitrophica]
MLLLVRRGLRASWGPTALLAVVALLAALVASAAPRAVTGIHARQVVHETSALTPLTRDVVTTRAGVAGAAGLTDAGPGAPAPRWAEYLDGLEALRAAQPEPLRSVLGAPDLGVTTGELGTEAGPASDVRHPTLLLRAAARVLDHVRVVEGRWPGATAVTPAFGGVGWGADGPVEVALSVPAAEELGWQVGQEHPVDGNPFVPAVVLVGTYEAVDPDGAYWAHQPAGERPLVVDDLNMGRSAQAAAYVDPSMLRVAAATGATTRAWFPLDVGASPRTGPDDVAPLLAQLRGLTGRTLEVVPGDPVTFQGTTEVVGTLERLAGQRAGVDAVVAVLASGPVGVTLAVLVLAARLVAERRRGTLALLSARGASPGRLRALTALEGLVVGLPAAAAGLAAGLLLVPAGPTAPVTAGQVAGALLAGLAPAAVLAAAGVPRGLRAGRADLAGPARGRARLVGEALVLAAAAASSSLLLQRGAVATDRDGVDPVLAVAPLLLALAVSLVAVRLAPLGARALEVLLARRRDLVPFLGAARATRDAAGGVVPLLALVLAVGVAGAGAVLQSTLAQGVTHQAWAAVGADLRVAGPVLGPDRVAALRDVEGVAEVATVADLGSRTLRVGVGGSSAGVLAVDAAALARVQDGVPGAVPAVADLAARAAAAAGDGGAEAAGGTGGDGSGPGGLAALTTAATGVRAGTPDVGLVAGRVVPTDVLATVDLLPGVASAGPHVVVDAAQAAGVLGDQPRPRLALVALDDDADRPAVVAAVRGLLPTAVVDDPAVQADALLGSPVAAGLRATSVAVVALAALGCVGVVGTTLLLGAPERGRLLALLRTLGMPRRAGRALAAWELGPWAAVALGVGAALAWALPVLVLAAVDLTALTGGDAPPPLRLDPLVLAAVAGGFLALVAGGAALAAATAPTSTDGALAERLRAGEER